jgi:signal transduction histidine kinase
VIRDFRHIAAQPASRYNVAVHIETRSNVAYFVAWLACALPGFLNLQTGQLSEWSATFWSAGFVAFTAAFIVYLRSAHFGRTPRAGILLVTVQTLAGLMMTLVSVGMSRYTSAIAFVFVAAQLPYVFSARGAWRWIAAQNALLPLIFWWFDGWLAAFSAGGAQAGIQVFALGKSVLEQSERTVRDALTRMNAELHLTRALLAESSRTAERLRISRDLHDTLGHHLTALSIQLDVASRRTEGPAAVHIQEAHAITRLLLGDVRDVVGRLRESGRVDLAACIRPLAIDVGELRVHLEMPEPLYLDDPAQAHVIVRCVQETITNAARHAAARNVWVHIGQGLDGLRLHAKDDGRGAAQLMWGNGLTAMRERFEEHAGHVDVTTAPGLGFEVRGFLPRSATPS